MTEYPAAWLTRILLLANIAVFLAMLGAIMEITDGDLSPDAIEAAQEDIEALIDPYVASQENIDAERYEVLIMSGFIHAGLLHLLMNMLFLYLFGKFCERELGTLKTAFTYFAAMVAGGGAAVFLYPEGAVGASGAISGLAAAAMLGAPEQPIIKHVPILHYFSLPLIRNLFSALVLAAVFVILPNLAVVTGVLPITEAGQQVAYGSHIAGAIAGALLAAVWYPDRARKGFWSLLVFTGLLAAVIMWPSETGKLYAAGALLAFVVLLRLFYWII